MGKIEWVLSWHQTNIEGRAFDRDWGLEVWKGEIEPTKEADKR